MNRKINFIVTFGLILISYMFAIFIQDIGEAITITGSFTNPMLGFIIPTIFYWQMHKDKPFCSY